jgi:ribose 5-phosphate isomerase B
MSEIRTKQFEVIYLATDHAGLALKEEIKQWLEAEQFIVVDGGAEVFDEEDDFPDFIRPVAEALAIQTDNRVGAIIFGGSGQGEAMAANRVRGVRAVVYYGGEKQIPALSRQHNDSNVLSIGARFVTSDEAKWAIWEWLHTEFLIDDKYTRRNKKLDE